MSSGIVICLMVVVIALNSIVALAGLALMALAIWVVVDQYGLYPISSVSGKDDIFAAAWIAIFTGFAFFLTSIFGIFAALKKSRALMLAYLILMFIIFLFESASAITAATNRDYLVGNSNLVKKQMLRYYGDGSTKQGKQITLTWNRVMQEVECCGTDSPLDWIEFNSTFRQTFGTTYAWPLNCCKRLSNFEVQDPESCKIGVSSNMFKQGCFKHIESVLSGYTWAVSWYGFAVLMLVFFTLLFAMIYYVLLE
ncbi:uroplakin-1a [Xyrauchen texanus]|uniref:uroplakin-1a n=1 Tax=Xyrauchen texanus TaxID=154827 RepID=UPI002241DD29|nr:uroplakin-1a [Xyrauchen texanus]XP_052000836.1 uroplakin-1a [Xyrauchen texanus]XP_052000837.1 uroplakin-1a [Xyrauchen texanus]XP_052000839.1 uroplakin-1a [Xyrauchen texanus]